MKYLLTILVFLMLAMIVKSGKMLTDTRTDIVYSVCNQSRVSADISERECGRLQDRWDREFLCSSNNTEPSTHCWVEVK